jgi:hypothetical protein
VIEANTDHHGRANNKMTYEHPMHVCGEVQGAARRAESCFARMTCIAVCSDNGCRNAARERRPRWAMNSVLLLVA